VKGSSKDGGPGSSACRSLKPHEVGHHKLRKPAMDEVPEGDLGVDGDVWAHAS